MYGNKPAIEIEKDIIRSDKAWERAVNPKAKIVLKQFQEMLKIDLNQVAKEGGNKSIHVDMEKNPREGHFWDILKIKQSDSKAFQEWFNAMKAEIQALND